MHSIGPITLVLCATEQKAELAESSLKALTMVNRLASTNPRARNDRKVHTTLITGSSDVKEMAVGYNAVYFCKILCACIFALAFNSALSSHEDIQ
jgi:hypothetical protein